LSSARHDHTATLLPNGKVLIAGGSNNNIYLPAAEVYDPATNAWASAGFMSSARDVPTAILISGKVLVAGGFTANGTLLSSTDLYDPDTNSWSAGSSMTTARCSHTATLLPSGRVLIAGGAPGWAASSAFSSAEIYTP
jgi:hypothetical protein